ncbi:hypothetical protein [Paraflavitalea speifideaquila]|uniref:hypothetical protein n=1 Tax=Paraflavitalea speifideaquila TaxID=3076558 RepID=UPI0028EC16BB|nr:hypothetical protein [Paraflavitalea speifideiaquila]
MAEQEYIQQQIQQELTRINTLLSDPGFMLTLAAGQEAAYYRALDKTPPAFPHIPEKLISKNTHEEKIASYLSVFYATECSIGAFMALQGSTPVYWLQQIVNGQLEADNRLLLHCFARATRKAGQAFLTQTTILPTDNSQLSTAAATLLEALQASSLNTAPIQLEAIDSLLRDTPFALRMAQCLEQANQGLTPATHSPGLISAGEGLTIEKRIRKSRLPLIWPAHLLWKQALLIWGIPRTSCPLN